jgi:hypothetical protein
MQFRLEACAGDMCWPAMAVQAMQDSCFAKGIFNNNGRRVNCTLLLFHSLHVLLLLLGTAALSLSQPGAVAQHLRAAHARTGTEGQQGQDTDQTLV